MNKGLDRYFLHYGIRKDDLELIRSLCDKYALDAEWLIEDVLKIYHEQKVDAIEMLDNDAEQVVNLAIQNIIKGKQV